MEAPIDITYRNLNQTHGIDALIHDRVAQLEDICDHILGCHVAVEKAQVDPNHDSPYRVRIDLTVPPGHELAVTKNPGENVQYEPLESVICSAFAATRRQLNELIERQQNYIQQHPERFSPGIVVKLFPSEHYGFLKTLDGREVLFHRNNVQQGFDQLMVGTQVRFFLSEGAEGPQANTVEIVSQPHQ